MSSSTIILGVDFKDNTMNLCKEAIRYALKLKSSITLVHTVEYIPYYPSFPHNEKKVQEFFNNDMKLQLGQLESFIKLFNVEVRSSVIEKGKTYEVICNVANRLDAKAIIVGVGQRYLFEEFIGSNTEKISKLAKQKVIIVNNINGDEIKNVLCAVDFSENSLSALASATRFAAFFNAKLNILNVYNSNKGELEVADHTSAISSNVISTELEKLNGEKELSQNIIIRKGVALDEILHTINEHDIDLLCIGSSGHSQLTHLFLGSTVAKIIRKAPCSIMVTPKG
jgi:nucleotide-binding universal stress UspA family protein